MMQFPYGAVYFRKSNPPKQDWERDYQTAKEDGFNIFRHWFMWGAIEIAPGVYDWEDYDRQMDLAAQMGMKVVIAEFMDAVPEWLYHSRKDLMFRHADGSVAANQMGVSCPAGGFGAGLCLDNEEARELGAGFLKALATHYKGHPALLGYDIWNESNFAPDVCYCEATKRAFREWLQEKYGNLQALGEAWCRYSYTSWEQVEPPRILDFYMESMDWLRFRQQNVYKQMKWRIDQIRSVDQDCMIVAHGTAATIDRQALSCYDEWEAAENVQLYGLTYVPCRHTGAPWKFYGAVDMTRAGAGEKKFWHAEMQGGPLWLQPQVLGRPKTDGRIPTERDVRLYNLISIACGSRGILYPRMRPILNGPLFGAFGPYAMDGSRTRRSEMASTIAKWANDPATKDLLDATPVKGEVGILLLNEAQIASLLMNSHGGRDAYSASAWGAYCAFFDSNIQADFVNLSHIDLYRILYLPYSVWLTDEQLKRLKEWVKEGGCLIAEACTGYFNGLGRARVGSEQEELTELFGARENEVEFTPDILDDLTFKCFDLTVGAGVALQAYDPAGGEVIGRFADGRHAVIRHSFGKGQTLLIGSHPAEAYMRSPDEGSRCFFKKAFEMFGATQRILVSDSAVKVRLQEDAQTGRKFIWVLNSAEDECRIRITLQGAKLKKVGILYWGDDAPTLVSEEEIDVMVSGKQASVFEII